MTVPAATNQRSCDHEALPVCVAAVDSFQLSASQTAASSLPSSLHAAACSQSHDGRAADSTDYRTQQLHSSSHTESNCDTVTQSETGDNGERMFSVAKPCAWNCLLTDLNL